MTHLMHRAGWACAAALALALTAALSRSIFAGPLDPPAPPGATQPQVEPRSPIPPVGWSGTFPIVISQPGSYFLTRSLTVATQVSAIQIAASDVALDLNGFTLTGTGSSVGSPVGVEVRGVQKNLSVRNGNLHSWFAGVDASDDATDYATQSRYEDLQVTNNTNYGIYVDSGSAVRRVIAQQDGTGIQIADRGSVYEGGMIEDSTVTENSVGVAVNANNVTVRNCVIDSTVSNGVNVYKSFDVVEGNTIQGSGSGAGVNILGGTVTTVTHNIFSNLAAGAVTGAGVSDRIGPSDSTLAGTQPWSNAGP